MKKILLACDTDNFPTGAYRFLEELHQANPFLLTGVFLHAVNDDLFLPNVFTTDNAIAAYTDEDVQAVSSSTKVFTDRCVHSGIEFRVHEGSKAYTVDDLIKESRYADLLVLSEELFFSSVDKHQPNFYLKQVLKKAECPVLTVPEHFETVAAIELAYDGSKESMYAIKHFCYLFPEYTKLPADVSYWVEDIDDDIPEMIYIEEYAARHFSNLRFIQRFFDKDKYLGTWAENKKSTLFVCGSYSRSTISELFGKSFVDDMIKHPGAVLFISHPIL